MDAKLKYSSGRHAGRTVNISTDEFLIGRGDQCQLRLDDDNISREHAIIRCQGDRCVIVDLGSTNGILINGIKVKDATLKPGDRITISGTCLKFIDDDWRPASAPRPTALAATAAAVELPDRSPAGSWTSAVAWGLLVLACVIVLALILPGSESSGTAAAQIDDQAVAGQDDGAAATQVAAPDTGNTTLGQTDPDDTGRNTLDRGDDTTDDTVTDVDNTVEDAPVEDAPVEDDFVADEMDWAGTDNDADDMDWVRTDNDPDDMDWAGIDNDPDDMVDADSVDDVPVRIRPPEPEPLRPEDPVHHNSPPSDNDIPVDYLWVTTEPPGARVSVNGKRRGRTPVYLGALDPGQYRVSFAKYGFEGLSVKADVPNDGDQQIYTLTQKNGTCLIRSDPPHMSVQYGPQLLGQTPLMLDSMTPGSYELRVFGLYYKPELIEIDVDEGEPNAVFVDLTPVMGDIEIVTIPPGAKVFVDNSFKGATKGNPDGVRRSKPFLLSGFKAGRHRVHVEYGGETAQKLVGVRPGQTAEAFLTIWYPDARFKLFSGKKVAGMVLERSADGSVVVALSRSEHERYLKEQIEAEEKLTESEAKHLMRLAKQAEWLDK